MLFVTAVLYILLIPAAVLAGKGFIAKGSDSRLRCVFTVVQSAVVLAITVMMFEIFRVYFINANLSGGFFRINETVFVSFYILFLSATEAFSRSKAKNGTAMPYVILCCTAVLLPLIYGAIVQAAAPDYFDQLLYALIGLAAVCLLHATNMLLDFSVRWQRVAVTAVNVLVFLTMTAAAAAVMVIAKSAYSAVDDATLGFKQIAVIAAVIAVIALPSLICVGTVMSRHFKLNDEKDLAD